MLKSFVLSFFLTVSFMQVCVSVKASDTLRLYFDIDHSTLNESQLRQIDELLVGSKSQEIVSLSITAYADFLASEAYNKALSERRAIQIKQYFVSKGYSGLIKECIGKGELPPELIDQPLGVPENRRVEIVVQIKPISVQQTSPVHISQAEVGDHIVMKNFNFQPGRHFLTAASQPELEVLLNSMAENPTLQIEIQGHICCEYTGKDGLDQDSYTNDLSVNRAKYIYAYLIKNGIATERLQYKGFGSEKPLIFPEKTIDDQNKNRRVEIVIIKK